MIDNYELSENKGRAKLLNDFKSSPYIIEYNFTEDKYDNIDCYATAYTPIECSLYAIEIKNRDIDYEKYADEGFILEYTKYKALMDTYTNSGYTPIYTNYFSDSTRITWDLTTLQDIDNRWITKYCTRTTAENYKKGDIPKKVVLLYPQEGKVRRTISK